MSRCTECGIRGVGIGDLAQNAEPSPLTTQDGAAPSPASIGGTCGEAKRDSRKWVPLLPATALASEGVTQVTLATGHALAVYRLGNEYFVSDDVCTHGEASLSDGEIEDGTIVCPYHQGSFDIRTGEARAYPCITPLRVYTVQIQSGSVCVLVDEAEAAPLSSP